MVRQATYNRTPDKLESDVESLSLTLRRTWSKGDISQASTAFIELSRLFPDLLTHDDDKSAPGASNYYHMLNVSSEASYQEVLTGFFKKLRQVLRNKSMRNRAREYTSLLDTGMVLRASRLRLSHDLCSVSKWLGAAGTSEHLGTPATGVPSQAPRPVRQPPAQGKPAAASGYSQEARQKKKTIGPESEKNKALEANNDVPLVLQLLEQATLVSAQELMALRAQVNYAPSLTLESLALRSGYINKEEAASLKLAEQLLSEEKVTLPQILVALYDERNNGVRMAESLQSRGWLSTYAPGWTPPG